MREKYGPWAVIAGGSDGTGSAFARRIAEQGINLVLVARRSDVLEATAASIREEFSVEVRTIVQDLAEADAAQQLAAATADLEVGLLVYNAGADPASLRFLDKELDDHLAMVQRNCATVLATSYLFGGPMVERGRGGLILLTSGAAWVGASYLATYGATKSFDLILGEALWAEWRNRGVDVLTMVLSVTDTPSLQRNIEAQGGATYGEMADPDDVAKTGLAQLGNGPTYSWGQPDPAKPSPIVAMDRRSAALAVSQPMEAMHGEG